MKCIDCKKLFSCEDEDGSIMKRCYVYGTFPDVYEERTCEKFEGVTIPNEFADIFKDIKLTEREIKFLDWIAGWDKATIENLRSILMKVRDV